MRRRQWLWNPRKWHIMLTIGGGSWGLGFMVCGPNGTDIYFGPIILTIQPPMPAHYRQYMTPDEIASEKTKIGALIIGKND